MKTIPTQIYRQFSNLLPFILLFCMFQLAGCGERAEQTEEPAEVEEIQETQEMIQLSAALEGTPDGDTEGSGSASVSIDPEAEEVCYELEVSDISEPTMAHIHRGAEGESGGVVVDFNLPQHGMNGCVTVSDSGVIEEIIENPRNFYVNVHNEDYPGGAVRGQLVIP